MFGKYVRSHVVTVTTCDAAFTYINACQLLVDGVQKLLDTSESSTYFYFLLKNKININFSLFLNHKK